MFWQLFHHLPVLSLYLGVSVYICLKVIGFHLYASRRCKWFTWSLLFDDASVVVGLVPLCMLSTLYFRGLNHQHRPDTVQPSQPSLKELETCYGASEPLLCRVDLPWYRTPLPGYCPKWSLVLPLFVLAMFGKYLDIKSLYYILHTWWGRYTPTKMFPLCTKR